MSVKQEPEQAQAGDEIRMGQERIPWNRILLVAAVLALVAGFCALYYTRNFTSSIGRDAEDIAQIARNISDGKGFTTRVIRPFNLAFRQPDDLGMPELNHGPLHPYIMAGLFSLRGPSDQAAAWTSLAFLLLTVVMTYLLGTLLFDWRAGLLAAVVMGISAPVIQVGMGAQEWPVATLWFTTLLLAIALHHRATMLKTQRAEVVYAGLAALPAALLYYTHSVFFFLALPLLVHLAFTGSHRIRQSMFFIVIFGLVISPLAYRNAVYTGSPILGANTWDIMAHTDTYPGDTLYRSASPENRELEVALLFPAQHFSAFSKKLIIGTNELLTAAAGMLGWVVLPFAVVSVLFRFKKPTANCVRGFLYGAGMPMVAAFALYSVGTGVMLLFAPAVAIFASAYFLLLLEAKKLHPEYAKAVVIGLVVMTALPTLGLVTWKDEGRNRQSVSTDQFFAANAEKMSPDLAVYTDVPWVAAWRTRSTGVWLPMSDDDVYRLVDRGIPMAAIVLTPESATYSPDEAWYVLHRVRIWRRYIENPEKGLKEILAESDTASDQKKNAGSFFKRVKRNFAISESIAGYRSKTIDPLAPDDIQVFIQPSE